MTRPSIGEAGTSTEPPRRGRWRSPGRILLVTLLVVATILVAWPVAVVLSLQAYFGSGFDDRRFDKLETQFDRRQAAFVKADARMRALAAAHPRAERISWILTMICVRDPGQSEMAAACSPTNPDDRATYRALRGVDVIVHQSKDDRRTFFRLYGNDPPRYTIMHVTDGTDADAYAEDRGFRSTRALKPEWTLLGPIPDIDRENRQWQ